MPVNISIGSTPVEELAFTAEGINDVINMGLSKLTELRKTFNAGFPGIAKSFNAIATDSVDIKLDPTKEEAEAIRYIESVGYISLSTLSIQTPQGMSSSYIELLVALSDAFKHHDNLLHKLLEPYYQFLAIIITNKTAINHSHFKTFNFDPINLARVKVKHVLDECYNGTYNVHATFGSVFKNVNDYKRSLAVLKDVYSGYKKINHSAVEKKVAELKTMLNDIAKSLEAGRLQDLDSDSIYIISNGALCVANELEFLATSYHRALVAATALNDVAVAVNQKYSKKK